MREQRTEKSSIRVLTHFLFNFSYKRYYNDVLRDAISFFKTGTGVFKYSAFYPNVFIQTRTFIAKTEIINREI